MPAVDRGFAVNLSLTHTHTTTGTHTQQYIKKRFSKP